MIKDLKIEKLDYSPGTVDETARQGAVGVRCCRYAAAVTSLLLSTHRCRHRKHHRCHHHAHQALHSQDDLRQCIYGHFLISHIMDVSILVMLPVSI